MFIIALSSSSFAIKLFSPILKHAKMPSTNAKIFIEELFEQGSQTACDLTQRNFSEQIELPDYYNAEKIKKAQKFYKSNFTAIFLNNLLGLMATLAVKEIRALLIFTNKSNAVNTAYKRYISTIKYVDLWCTGEFKQGTKLWQSFSIVKSMHSAASENFCKFCKIRINQKQMAITQLSFVGFVVTKPHMLGIHNFSREDLENYLHLWRIIGNLLGMDDRYNICRDSLEETREICDILIEKFFKSELYKLHKDYIKMISVFTEALQPVTVAIGNYKPFLRYLFVITNVESDIMVRLNLKEKLQFGLIKILVVSLKFKIFRILHNFVIRLTACWIPSLHFF